MKQNATVYCPIRKKKKKSQLQLTLAGYTEQPFPSHGKQEATQARTAASLLVTQTLPL